MNSTALQGIRVIEFGHVWATPYCTSVLAEMGAEVIKVESQRRLDAHRLQGPYPDKKKGLNRSGVWNAQNRGKLGCTLNLATEAGARLARSLVAQSDIVVENYRPGVMKKLGLDYSALKVVNPSIIMVYMTGFGETGPYSHFASYGTMLEAFSGVASVTGHPGGLPACIGEAYPDPLVGLYGVLSILAALNHRAETGEGQSIDLSQYEAIVCHLPQAIMDYDMNGRVAGPRGNRDAVMAPHGCYRSQGDDKWVAIAIATDAEWRAFCQALGSPEWCLDERFADAYGRWRHQDELDAHIERWTLQHSAYAIMTLLQAAGVAAGPSLNIAELMSDPHTQSREVFVEVNHPEIGPQIMVGPAWRMSQTPGSIQRPAPLLGGDNDYVFGKLLNLSPAEIEQLAADQVIY